MIQRLNEDWFKQIESKIMQKQEVIDFLNDGGVVSVNQTMDRSPDNIWDNVEDIYIGDYATYIVRKNEYDEELSFLVSRLEDAKWIEFEIWNDDVAISGYMALDDYGEDAPLQFYSWDGFECYGDIQKTKPQTEDESILKKWETIYNVIVDCHISSKLVENAFNKKTITLIDMWTDDSNNEVELWINSSKLDTGDD